MSATIRSQLGLAINRLANSVVAGQAILAQAPAADLLVTLCAIAEQTRRSIQQIERLLDRWTTVLTELLDGNRANEEAIFNGFESGGHTPAGIIDEAGAALTLMDIRIDQIRAMAPASSVIPPAARIQVPTLSLPVFDGQPNNWYGFWDAFRNAVDQNPSFSASQKMTYLYGQLKGTAKSLVEGFPLTDGNYAIVVDILKSRYGDDNRRAAELQSELLRLPKATSAPGSLRSFNEGMERICRQLTGLGIDTDTNPFLKTTIQEKIPPEVRAYLADKEIEGGVAWTPRQWRDGLARAVKVREAAFLDKEATPSHAHQPRHSASGEKAKAQLPRRTFPVVGENSPQEKKEHKSGCSLCSKDGHPPSRCPEYNTPEKRKERLKRQKRCLICAREGHFAKECPSQLKCSNCQGRHHFLICFKKQKPGSGGNNVPLGKAKPRESRTDAEKNNTVIGVCQADGTPIEEGARRPAYLMMNKVVVYNNRDPANPLEVPVFLDSGSQTSFITRRLVQSIAPRKVANEQLLVAGFVGNGESNFSRFNSPRFSVLLRRTDGGWEQLILNRTEKITPKFEYLSEGPNVKEEELIEEIGEPQILIGIREFWKLFRDHTEIRPGIYRIDTLIGPIFGGAFSPEEWDEFDTEKPTNSMPVVMAQTGKGLPEDALIKQLWSLETIGISDCPAQNDEEKAVKLFNESIRRDPEGRYEVGWPWRSVSPSLSDNFSIAFSRLVSLGPKLRALPEFCRKYNEVIEEQLSKNIIEESVRNGSLEHFLPHHAVITEKKLRIVYDASAHKKGELSLNDNLIPGPNLVPDLAGILIRFRTCPVPVLADVEKAFLMVGLQEKDRDYAKFLWLKNPTLPPTPQNLRIFRFRRIAFGVVSSPFILAATLKHHLLSEGSNFATEMRDNMYVDNLLILAQTVAEAKDKALRARDILAKAKMRLREFVSSYSEILESVPEEDRLQADRPKVLGLNWDLAKDRLHFKLPEAPGGVVTRRKVLSTISSFFDPLGLCSPILVKAKIFFQSLWGIGKGWDESLPEICAKQWQDLVDEWKEGCIPIPRLTIIYGAESVQLHIFTDASPDAYATAVYLRVKQAEVVRTALIFAKSRLRPVKMVEKDGLTIPKLELLGVLVGVRAKGFVAQNLHKAVDEIYLWMDSQIVLSWVGSKAPQPIFVANRLAEIRRHREITYQYVRSAQNPADLGTRGVIYKDLISCELWWEGPTWLKDEPEAWPKEYPAAVLPPEETAEPNVATPVHVKTDERPSIMDPGRFSNWNEFSAFVAVWFKFLASVFQNSNKFKEKFPIITKMSKCGFCTVSDRKIVKDWIILSDQKQFKVGETAPNTFKDKSGLIRLKTRLAYADQSAYFKYPPVLDRHSRVTELLIRDAHYRLMHGGVDSTLSKFLSSYWCPQARKLARKIVANCPLCKKDRARTFPLPDMPPWPEKRVRPSPPFCFTGLDYFGPILFKGLEGPSKAWVVIFTCFSTRAVHLEPVDNMEAEGFLQCFRKFVARRGIPKEILSDHGSQLVLAKKAFQLCPDLAIEWKMTPQLSPWAGGLYERLVALAKGAVRRGLGRKLLPWGQFSTFFVEVEAILNDRPITFVSDDREGPTALRPIDFLRPLARISVPDPVEGEDEVYRPSPAEKLIHLWWATNRALREFWDIWSRDYLLLLRGRTQVEHSGPRLQAKETPKVGHLVLVAQDFPKTWWPLGRILELQGPEGRARSAIVLMPNGHTLVRPINRLVPLEVVPEGTAQNEAIEGRPPQIDLIEEEEEVEPVSQLFLLEDREPKSLSREPGKRRVRPSAKLKDYFLFLVLSVLIFTEFSAAGIPLTCTKGGVYIRPPEKSTNMEICCGGTCMTRNPRSTPFLLPIPADVLVTGYDCISTFRDGNYTTVSEQKVRCAAVEVCQTFDCTFCWERVLNPECSPVISSILLAILFLICGTVVSLVILVSCCCKTTYKSCRQLCRLVTCCWPRFWAKTFRNERNRHEPKWSDLYEELLPPRVHPRRQYRDHRWNPLTRLGHVLAVISLCLTLLLTSEAGIEIISMTAKTEECWKGNNSTECTFNSVTSLTLLPAGQPVDLIIRSPESQPLGTFSFILESLTLECIPEIKAWLRPYKISTFAVKRCPGMGSCQGNSCAELRANHSVPELKERENMPGNNFCVDSTSFLWNQCLGTASACLYYRPHIQWTSKVVYELIECPIWEHRMHIILKLDVPGQETMTERVKLIPGRTFHWDVANISLTPSPLGQAPLPILNGRFLSGNVDNALVPNFPLDLYCASEEDAKVGTDCQLAINTCSGCSPDHQNGRMNCNCRELDLEAMIADPKNRLPLLLGQLEIWPMMNRYYAVVPYTPVNVITKMEGLTLTVSQEKALCTIVPRNLTGCYRCRTGGRFEYSCQSTKGTLVALIMCQDGTTWASTCTANQTEAHAVLSWDYPAVNTICMVECTAGKTKFLLQGNLVYIPPSREFWMRAGQVEGSRTNDLPSIKLSFNVWSHVLAWAAQFPQNIILVIAIVIGLIVLYLFVKLNPAFRMYRTVARLMVIIGLIGPIRCSDEDYGFQHIPIFIIVAIALAGIGIFLSLIVRITTLIEDGWISCRRRGHISPTH